MSATSCSCGRGAPRRGAAASATSPTTCCCVITARSSSLIVPNSSAGTRYHSCPRRAPGPYTHGPPGPPPATPAHLVELHSLPASTGRTGSGARTANSVADPRGYVSLNVSGVPHWLGHARQEDRVSNQGNFPDLAREQPQSYLHDNEEFCPGSKDLCPIGRVCYQLWACRGGPVETPPGSPLLPVVHIPGGGGGRLPGPGCPRRAPTPRRESNGTR